jgi:superfamily I DNA and/or RNA helicase
VTRPRIRTAATAAHPDGVDAAALQHSLGTLLTIPPEQGIFLPETWRLAPSICAYTSELFYEGKLRSRSGLENQRLSGTDGFDGAGLWVVDALHDGNRNYADEELAIVSGLVARLTVPGACWTDMNGVSLGLTGEDILVVAPYNANVTRLSARLDGTGVRVETVDKFQGQEAPVVIYSMATSRPEDAPRGWSFCTA